MYHQPVHLFAPINSVLGQKDVLADMVDTIIMRVTSNLSITPKALASAGFSIADVHELHAEALALAQSSFWWPTEQFVAIEGV